MKKISMFVVTMLCMMMLVNGAAFAADLNFKDMPADGSWNRASLEKAVDNNLLNGFPDGSIRPSATMDRSQMAAIMCRSFGAPAGDNAYLKEFVDIDTNAWYYTSEKMELAKAVEMKLFEGNGKKELNPTGTTLREEAFMVVARAFKVEPLSAEETKTVLAVFADYAKVSDWAAPTAAALVKAGYIQGSVVGEKRCLSPLGELNRSEFAVMMDHLVAVFVDNQNEVPTNDVGGTVVVRTGDVHFGSITINGSLVLGEGVGNGSVILDETAVKGEQILRSGEVGSPVKTAVIANTAKHEAPEVADVLTASYEPKDALGPISYQWQVQDGTNWSNIENATAESYCVSEDTLGKNLRVVVTGAQDYCATSEETKAVVVVSTKIIGVEKAVWSNTATPNAENVNKFMASLWAEDSVFSAEGAALTVHSDKITKDMLTFIETNWGGSSVPVALVFDGTAEQGVNADANWSNAVLHWIDLKDIVYNSKTSVGVADNAFSFEIEYVGGYATHLITLAQPKWTAETPNAADVNALMAELWNEETGVFAADGTALTIYCDNITDDMKTKIRTAWGGASVPVKMVINGDKMKAGAPDVNWDNSFVDWINLDDAVMNGTVERVLPNNKNFKYTVTYTEGKEFTKYFDTLAQPQWTAETPNAKDVNALMAELWNKETGVFSADGTTLTINCGNITDDMKTKIKTAWGGASVPVKLVFDDEAAVAAGLNRDVNWDNAYLDWIGLNDTKTIGTTTRNIPESNDNYSYTVVYSDNIDTLGRPQCTTTQPNVNQMNEFMASLWAKDSVFSVEGTVLTIHMDKITDEMLAFINTNYGGASVPVALVFNDTAMQVKGLSKDANWNNAYLDWINLKDATTAGTVTRDVPNTLLHYTVIYA